MFAFAAAFFWRLARALRRGSALRLGTHVGPSIAGRQRYQPFSRRVRIEFLRADSEFESAAIISHSGVGLTQLIEADPQIKCIIGVCRIVSHGFEKGLLRVRPARLRNIVQAEREMQMSRPRLFRQHRLQFAFIFNIGERFLQ